MKTMEYELNDIKDFLEECIEKVEKGTNKYYEIQGLISYCDDGLNSIYDEREKARERRHNKRVKECKEYFQKMDKVVPKYRELRAGEIGKYIGCTASKMTNILYELIDLNMAEKVKHGDIVMYMITK